MTGSREGGYTVIDVVIAGALLIPLLGVLITASRVASGAMVANDRSAGAMNVARHAVRSVEQLLQSGRLDTLQTRATDLDVAQNSGFGGVQPEVGDWIAAPQLEARSALRFEAASGIRNAGARLTTPPCALELALDVGETDNDVDDDGDGLIDEGSLVMTTGTTSTVLASGIEACAFELDGRLVRLRLRVARSGRDRVVHRATVEHVIHVRN